VPLYTVNVNLRGQADIFELQAEFCPVRLKHRCIHLAATVDQKSTIILE